MTPSDQNFSRAHPPRADFPTTHWTVVLTAANPAVPLAGQALEKLCRTYWRPVYAFIRQQRQSPEDALDSTQDFFAHFLAKEQVRLADPKRGRLRSFLLVAIKHFLADQRESARAQKRGGKCSFLSLEVLLEAENCLLAQIVDPGATPDQAYEQQWAFGLLDRALARLRQKFAGLGEGQQFDALKEMIWGGATARSQVEIAAQLNLTPNALGVTVHRLRRRYGELLREAVSRTVVDPGEIDDELRHLIAVISS